MEELLFRSGLHETQLVRTLCISPSHKPLPQNDLRQQKGRQAPIRKGGRHQSEREAGTKSTIASETIRFDLKAWFSISSAHLDSSHPPINGIRRAMTRIDRYILTIYFRVLMVCFLSLSGLLIVVHVFTNLEEFIEYGHTRGSLLRGLVEYYGPYMLGIFDRMSGVLTMMAVMFVVAWLARTNELTAILAAGISKGRVVKPIIYASLGILALSVVNRELLIPRFADSLGKSPQDLAGSRQLPMRPMFDQDQEILIGGRHLMSGTGSIEEPVFRLEGPSIVLGKQISAVSATYRERQ